MSTGSDSNFDKWFNRVASACAILAVPAVTFATFWVRAEIDSRTDAFAKQEDVTAVAQDLTLYKKETTAILESIKNTLAGVNTTLAVLSEKMQNDARQDRRIDDLESRVRPLERSMNNP